MAVLFKDRQCLYNGANHFMFKVKTVLRVVAERPLSVPHVICAIFVFIYLFIFEVSSLFFVC